MSKTIRVFLISVIYVLLLFTSACGNKVDNELSNSEVTELATNQPEGFVFEPQEIQPIGEIPDSLLLSNFSEQSEGPEFTRDSTFDEIINTVLDSPQLAEKFQGQQLEDAIVFGTENTNSQAEFSEYYMNYSANGTLPNFINFSDLQDIIRNDNAENYAFLIKFQPGRAVHEYQFSLGRDTVFVDMFVRDQINLEFLVSTSADWFYPNDYFQENMSQFQYFDDEWFYVLISLDRNFVYNCLLWQETDPSNHIYVNFDISDDLSDEYKQVDSPLGLNLTFHLMQEEPPFRIESFTIYTFGGSKNGESITSNEEIIINQNADEKFQLAVEFFHNGDYYNAYLLLKDLNGYDTSATYLAECERLLQTIEIPNPRVAEAITKSMHTSGMQVYDYLYTFQAEKIEALDLSNCKIEDLSFISPFINLKELNLDGNAISDLMPLKDIYSLENLSLARNNITDILPLYNLTNLQVLDLSDNLIADVAGLSNLTSLKQLDLSTNDIGSIAGLYNLQNLESVDLSFNFISSVSALSSSPIKELNILNTQIDNLNAVTGFEKLESLTAGFRYIRAGQTRSFLYRKKYEDDNYFFMGLRGFEYLSGLSNIKSLSLARLTTESLAPLTTMPNLEIFRLYAYSGPDDYEVLETLIGLKELRLDSWGRNFGDVSFLSNMSNLEKLNIGVITASDYSPLKDLKNLQEYSAGCCLRVDLPFLTNFKEMRSLQLSYWGDLDDLSPLLELDQLEYLDLTGCSINDLSVISQLESLNYFKLWDGQIKNFDDLDKLANLKYLDLSSIEVPNVDVFDKTDPSIIEDFDNLEFGRVTVKAGEKSNGYAINDRNDIFSIKAQDIDIAPDVPLEIPEYSEYWVGSLEDLYNLVEFDNSQNLIINIPAGLQENGNPVKLTIPKNVRYLTISSFSSEPVELELDFGDQKSLERLIIGYIDLSEYGNNGFGQGEFIIDNLDGLSGCSNLKEIYINSAKINDISGLADLDKLEIVELKKNNISDISALANKIYLKELNVSSNRIENIDMLETCIRLQDADFNGNPITDFSVLDRLPLFYGEDNL